MIERKELVDFLLGFWNFISINFHGRLNFAFPGFEASIIYGFIIDFVADVSNTLLLMMSETKVVENLNDHIFISIGLLADLGYRWFPHPIDPRAHRIIKLRVIIRFGVIKRLSKWWVLLVAVILVQQIFLDVAGLIHETNRVIFRVIPIEIILLYFLGICQIGHIAHFELLQVLLSARLLINHMNISSLLFQSKACLFYRLQRILLEAISYHLVRRIIHSFIYKITDNPARGYYRLFFFWREILLLFFWNHMLQIGRSI